MRGSKPHIRIEREALTGDQAAPDWFSDYARAEWERVLPKLVERKILTVDNLGTLENYCVQQGLAREMEKEIQTKGAVMLVYSLTKAGEAVVTGMRKNPAVAIQTAAMDKARLMAAELGLTPVSRSRPTVHKDDDDQGDGLFDWEQA